jgi:lysozyme
VTGFNETSYSVVVGGTDISSRLARYLLDLSVEDKAGTVSDRATITLDDSGGRLALPAARAPVTIALGRGGATSVFEGFVDDARSRGDRGSGRVLSIEAKGMDTGAALKQPREKHWDDQTLGAVMDEAARLGGLASMHVAGGLAAIERPYWAMDGESLIAFGRRLAREVGGTFKIVGSRGIMVPRGAGTSAGGAALTAVTAAAPGNLISWDLAPRLTRPRFAGIVGSQTAAAGTPAGRTGWTGCRRRPDSPTGVSPKGRRQQMAALSHAGGALRRRRLPGRRRLANGVTPTARATSDGFRTFRLPCSSIRSGSRSSGEPGRSASSLLPPSEHSSRAPSKPIPAGCWRPCRAWRLAPRAPPPRSHASSRRRTCAMAKVSRRTRLIGGVLALAIAVVGGFEGLKTVAYRDIVGVPTVCFGETRGVDMGDRYTVEQCQVMLGDGLKEFEQGMTACLDHPERIPDKSYVAFLSATYNIGVKAFCGSSMRRLIDAGDIRGACDALLKWTKAGGKTIPGLVRRRNEERALCLDGVEGK